METSFSTRKDIQVHGIPRSRVITPECDCDLDTSSLVTPRRFLIRRVFTF